ncbi:hypothetical protein Bacsa_2469 [Phocaeicola salanitronis DSM 18170]|uniref:Uncharacterized protein n=1 Tax=Phocaeicola salanitronis (strain DSM 18170 / JCM 13657 / CCUG 60908 / BL78) TaxID=667015 RepID=F0R845_PHOSB|nr:hypothetical protein Bacsa_2469 [Phocaeicola salanitronis DSM 18170]
MANIITLKRIGKFIIWFWNKYIKKRYIPYIDLEFYYPNYLFIALGCLVVAIFLVIAVTYFSIK